MFFSAPKFNGNLNHWDVSRVENMEGMFYDATSFNQPIGDWNVSNVQNMEGMFYDAISFNQSLNDWDVSNVWNMAQMFRNARSFNQPIGDWNISNLRYISNMFSDAISFNQPLSDWNASKVRDMTYTFYNAASFNGNLSNWDVSGVTSMAYTFQDASSFNQSLNDWDVSNVRNMESMFSDASSFNQPIGDWDVSNVWSMTSMFSDASSFNQPIGDWDVSNVKKMRAVFSGASSFNQPLNDWDVSKVDDMVYMFNNAHAFNQSLNDWDVSSVTDMAHMFNNAHAFNQPIGDWDVSSLDSEPIRFASYVYSFVGLLNNLPEFNQDLSEWNICHLKHATSWRYELYRGSDSWDFANRPRWDAPCIRKISSSNKEYFIGDEIIIEAEFDVNVNVVGQPKLELVFDNETRKASYVNGSGTKKINFKYVVQEGDRSTRSKNGKKLLLEAGSSIKNNGNVIAALNLPIGPRSLKDTSVVEVLGKEGPLFVSKWDTTKTSNGSSNARSVKLPLQENGEYDFIVLWGDGKSDSITSWNQSETTHTYDAGGVYTIKIAGKIKGFAFKNQGDKKKLLSISNAGSLNFGNDGGYFYGASNLERIQGVNLTGTTNLSSMFKDATKFNQTEVQYWDVTNITDMSSMFENTTSFNQNLIRWDVVNVTNMSRMFLESSFNHNITRWRACNVQDYTLFANTTLPNSNWPEFDHPCVLSVNSPNPDGSYVAGDTIRISLKFNEKIVYTGTPKLELNFSLENKKASAVSGSNTDTLHFEYLVTLLDSTDDLDYEDYSGINISPLTHDPFSALTVDNGEIQSLATGKNAILFLPTGKKSLGGVKNISIKKSEELFVSAWNTRPTSSGSSASNQIDLPLKIGGNHNMIIDWGDGNTTNVTKDYTEGKKHTYEQPGVYTLKILGRIDGFGFNGRGR